MLTGRLPYGAAVTRTRSPSEQRRLRYVTARQYNPDVPEWMDEAIRRAVHPDPLKRCQALSEFEYDLRTPKSIRQPGYVPLVERNPLLFWKIVSLVLTLIVLALIARLS